MQAREIFDDLGQQIRCDRRDHADPQPSRKLVARGACEVAEFVDGTQDVADALQKLFAELGQRHLPRAAFQQFAAEDFLHFLDLHRQGRLRNRAGVCRPSEMSVPGQCVEVAKLPQRDVDHQIILSLSSLNPALPDGKGCVESRTDG